MLTALLNDVATLPHALVLVLDDYHLFDSGPADDALAFLLVHLLPQIHLVIATRGIHVYPWRGCVPGAS